MEMLMNANDVAERLSMTRREVYGAVRRGDLDAIRICSRTIRFAPKDVRAFERRRRRAYAALLITALHDFGVSDRQLDRVPSSELSRLVTASLHRGPVVTARTFRQLATEWTFSRMLWALRATAEADAARGDAEALAWLERLAGMGLREERPTG